MRQMIILLAILVLAVVVYAAPICTVDGIVGPAEECDPGNVTAPANDSACPGMCQQDCRCSKGTNNALFDLAVGHNLLFSKVQDLLHIIKDMLFQLEMKTIEIQLTDFNCSSQPVSFWIPANEDPYGKLNEIDQLIKLLIYAIDKNEAAYDITPTELALANSYLTAAERCISINEYRQAFNCKCLAYRSPLLGLTDTSVQCDVQGVCIGGGQ